VRIGVRVWIDEEVMRNTRETGFDGRNQVWDKGKQVSIVTL
jgi:hypothetical protein